MRFLQLLLLIAVLIMPACAPDVIGAQPAPETTVPSPSSEPGGGLPPQAVLDAQKQWVERLGALGVQVRIIDIEQATWPDTCLGLGRPEEMCAQVTTPGWRVIAEINGQEHEARTDETASIIRLVDE